MQHVGLIGQFGDRSAAADGQSVKTWTLYDYISQTKQWRIVRVDTKNRKKHPLRMMLAFAICLLTCRTIILMVSENGRKSLYPKLAKWAGLTHTRIFQCTIGGALPEQIERHPEWVDYLNHFQINWVESPQLVRSLSRLGVSNAQYLPNFKNLHPKRSTECCRGAFPLRFCTFSRIQKEKGIDLAIAAVEAANRHFGKCVARLDIYGFIENDYCEQFDKLLKQSTDAISYYGVVAFSQSVETISRYDALLFPTTYPGEAMAGTIIDALFAGTPVVASDWHFNAELVQNGKTGYCYPYDQPEELNCLIQQIIDSPQMLTKLRPFCLAASESYSATNVVPQILNAIGKTCS